jgi:hypothetical protein
MFKDALAPNSSLYLMGALMVSKLSQMRESAIENLQKGSGPLPLHIPLIQKQLLFATE